jgi:MFS family permease
LLNFPPALRHRDFRLLWAGQAISIAGSRMQAAAILWQVYAITGSPLALGAVGLAHVLPLLAVSLFAGVAADVFDRRKLMLGTQTSMLLLALLLGVLTLRGLQSAVPIYAISALVAVAWAFDAPARQALIPRLVPAHALAGAFSLNSTVFQLGSIVGPALFGLVIARTGVAAAYFINAASFLAVIGALLAMRPVPPAPAATERAPQVSVRAALEGLRFVRLQPIIFSSMLLDFFATFFGAATALLPMFAQDILKVGAAGYGWLYAAQAVGAAIIGVLLSLLPPLPHAGRVMLLAVGVYGLATIAFGLAPNFALAFGALAVAGAADMVSMVIRNTARNLLTPDALRGRMTSVNMVFFMGGPQLGELEAGAAAALLGAPAAMVTGGVGCLLALGWIAARYPQLRTYAGAPAQPAAAGAAQPVVASAD